MRSSRSPGASRRSGRACVTGTTCWGAACIECGHVAELCCGDTVGDTGTCDAGLVCMAGICH